MINKINKLSLWKNMKKGDIQQQISEEQCTAVHNIILKFHLVLEILEWCWENKDTKYDMYAVYTVLQACMHVYEDESTLTSISCMLFSLDEDEDNLPVDIITEVNKFNIQMLVFFIF